MTQLTANDVSTKTFVAGIPFASYVMNACGVRDTTLEELQTLGGSASSAIVMKSCTLVPRVGNPEPRLAHLPNGILQSMGLPNLGYEKYIEFIPQLKKYGKPIICSIAESNMRGRQKIIDAFLESDVDIVGVNTSCPNDTSLCGRMLCYDMHDFQVMLSRIKHRTDKPLKLKLPPYNDPWQQSFVADACVRYGVKCVTLINGVGRCLVIDTEKESAIIKATNGYGALAGEMTKYQALGNVRAFYDLFEGQCSIIGVGGIRTGEDVFQFLLAGADAVQIGTTFEKEGHACFERINRELREIMAIHGYTTIESAKGKMKRL